MSDRPNGKAHDKGNGDGDGTVRILLLEDSKTDVQLIEHELKRSELPTSIQVVENREDFEQALLREPPPDLVLSDYSLKGYDGLSAIETVRQRRPLLPVVIVTGSLDEETAANCIKAGAEDYVLKDRLSRLSPAVMNALKTKADREAKRLAEELLIRKNEELERSNAELRQFAYVASHDLQEPLRMVVAYTQLLANRYKGKLDSDADEFIEYAVNGALRAQNLILDLLDYAQVGANQEFTTVNCDAALNEALAALKRRVDESKAQIKRTPLPEIRGNHRHIVQLFQNLLHNAMKFRRQEPLVIEVGAEKKADEWLFHVKDNGIGLDPQYSERIFVIFQQLHARDAYPGTGIGLAICKKIVSLHGGRIWVESKPNEGATFYFTLKA